MRLKLDLHPIYNDSRRIEAALSEIIDEAVAKRATEIEIIPGKGSGALKKSVIRFLDRPEIKAKYHRIEKDGDNWGRLFVHFRHLAPDPGKKPKERQKPADVVVSCALCGDGMVLDVRDDVSESRHHCPWCGSPNLVSIHRDRSGEAHGVAELAFDEESGWG